MTYANVTDVADELGRPISDLSAAEVAQITRWLARVEARIGRKVGDLSAKVMDPDFLTTVIGVEVDVVVRRVNNPEGLLSEKGDDYAYTRSEAAASSDLMPTEAEWAELLPRVSHGAFSVRPGWSS